MAFDTTIQARLQAELDAVLGPDGYAWLAELLSLMQRYGNLIPTSRPCRWDERDVVLITYGDQVQEVGRPALEALGRFLSDYDLTGLTSTVHLLPFCPATSDDGFSVVDYRQVDPLLGRWSDIRQLGEQVELMFDLVLNHVSRESAWFQGYLRGDAQYANYFLEIDPGTDLSAVTRPRSLPLLTPVETSRGQRHVWTTFSADQIDLNYTHAPLLMEMLDVFLFYLQQGARFVRLDAIAYVGKETGTDCIHLPRAHAVVKLLRTLVDALAPHVVLLTETNVPHRENLSYFGAGDEAHMVYQFSLPPLLADALLQEDAGVLCSWLGSLPETAPGTTFFNFTASHDGIGVRPLEGLLPKARRAQLVQRAERQGGLVSTRRHLDGTDSPYELNITYLDLLWDERAEDLRGNLRRFLASQAMMLALRGIPAVYFQSLVGSRNDIPAVTESGIARRINRRKFQRHELDRMLHDPTSVQQAVFHAYQHLLQIRIAQPAFHPDGGQAVLPASHPALLAVLRTAPPTATAQTSAGSERQQILMLANVSGEELLLDPVWWDGMTLGRDLLGTPHPLEPPAWRLAPYQVAWLEVNQKRS